MIETPLEQQLVEVRAVERLGAIVPLMTAIRTLTEDVVALDPTLGTQCSAILEALAGVGDATRQAIEDVGNRAADRDPGAVRTEWTS